jgi:mannonate dehydratase
MSFEKMKLGLGLYRHQLDAEHYRFARQCGCTHLVVHLVDYFRSSRSNKPDDQPVGDDAGWGLAGDPNKLLTYEELAALKKQINDAGLKLEAIENFDPAHWHDVLLDGPKKQQQLENLKTIIRNVGRAGIPIFGYNFSIAGVAGRVKGRFARGNTEAVGMDGPFDKPMPRGMAWNMVYDPNAPPGTVPSATRAQLWQRLKDFLDAGAGCRRSRRHARRASRRSAHADDSRSAPPRVSAAPLPEAH